MEYVMIISKVPLITARRPQDCNGEASASRTMHNEWLETSDLDVVSLVMLLLVTTQATEKAGLRGEDAAQ